MVEVGAGMLYARPIPRLAGEGHFFPANRYKRFYRRNAEAVCGGSDDKEERESQGRAGA